MTEDVHLRVSFGAVRIDWLISVFARSFDWLFARKWLTPFSYWFQYFNWAGPISWVFSTVMNIVPGREWPSSVQKKSCFDNFLAVTHNLCSVTIELLRNKKGILRRKRLNGKRKTRSYQKLPLFLLCGISTGYVHVFNSRDSESNWQALNTSSLRN